MKTLLECFEKMKHLPLAKTILIKSENDLSKINFPYYMKSSIAEHKLEKKAVLRIENINQAKLEYSRLKKEFPHSPIVIQEQIIGTEMIIGLKKDEVFEKLLLIGFGGTNAEILKDVTFLAIPANKNEIKIALESLKLYPSLFKSKDFHMPLTDDCENLSLSKTKLKFKVNTPDVYEPGFLTRQKYAINQFLDLALEVSKLDFEELDLNPVILTEKNAIIVDARGSF